MDYGGNLFKHLFSYINNISLIANLKCDLNFQCDINLVKIKSLLCINYNNLTGLILCKFLFFINSIMSIDQERSFQLFCEMFGLIVVVVSVVSCISTCFFYCISF